MTKITADHDACDWTGFSLSKEVVEAVMKQSGPVRMICRLTENYAQKGPTRLQAALSLHLSAQRPSLQN